MGDGMRVEAQGRVKERGGEEKGRKTKEAGEERLCYAL
jgi:hypothetical protein